MTQRYGFLNVNIKLSHRQLRCYGVSIKNAWKIVTCLIFLWKVSQLRLNVANDVDTLDICDKVT